MSEHRINLTDRQVKLLRLLVEGPVSVTHLEEADAAHLVILQNRGIIEIRQDGRGRVDAYLTALGFDLTHALNAR